MDDSWRRAVLRRCRMSSVQIAKKLKLARSTVSRVVEQAGLSRAKSLELPVPVERYVGSGNGQFNYPFGVATDAAGHVYTRATT